jgi:hypothetical protein
MRSRSAKTRDDIPVVFLRNTPKSKLLWRPDFQPVREAWAQFKSQVGDIPEKHAGFGTFLHANGNGPAKPRLSWRAGSLTRNFAVVPCRSAISL